MNQSGYNEPILTNPGLKPTVHLLRMEEVYILVEGGKP